MSRKHVSTRRRPAPRNPGRPPLPFLAAGRHLDNPTGRRHPGPAERGLRPAAAELRGQPGPDRFASQLPVARRRLLAVPDPDQGRALAEAGRHEQRRRHAKVVGANPASRAVGLDKQAGVSNYLIGNDPSQWHTDVPNYGKVSYEGVYRGIDLVYHGNQKQLEYDFVVAPGADPRTIRLAFDGIRSASLDRAGNLVLHTSGGDVIEQAPVVYQEINGRHQAVAGRYVLQGNHQVGFQVGRYDHSKPLVIDPVLSYSTYLGATAAGTPSPWIAQAVHT